MLILSKYLRTQHQTCLTNATAQLINDHPDQLIHFAKYFHPATAMQVEASVGGDIFGLVYGKMSSDFATQPGYIEDEIRSVDVTCISCLMTKSVVLCVYGIESFRHLHIGICAWNKPSSFAAGMAHRC